MVQGPVVGPILCSGSTPSLARSASVAWTVHVTHPGLHLLLDLCPGLQTRASSRLLKSACGALQPFQAGHLLSRHPISGAHPGCPGRNPGLVLECLPRSRRCVRASRGWSPCGQKLALCVKHLSPHPAHQAIHSSGPFRRPRLRGREGASNHLW